MSFVHDNVAITEATLRSQGGLITNPSASRQLLARDVHIYSPQVEQICILHQPHHILELRTSFATNLVGIHRLTLPTLQSTSIANREYTAPPTSAIHLHQSQNSYSMCNYQQRNYRCVLCNNRTTHRSAIPMFCAEALRRTPPTHCDLIGPDLARADTHLCRNCKQNRSPEAPPPAPPSKSMQPPPPPPQPKTGRGRAWEI